MENFVSNPLQKQRGALLLRIRTIENLSRLNDELNMQIFLDQLKSIIRCEDTCMVAVMPLVLQKLVR